METVDVELAHWAVGPAGLAAIDRAVELLRDDADALRLATALRRDLDPARAAFTSTAALARLSAVAAGVERAEALVLTREAAEQASRPAVARWRADRVASAGLPLSDWCAGTGADAVELARHGPVLALERDAGRAVLAVHRARVLGRDVEVVVGDALVPPAAATDRVRGGIVHADPDRRDAAGRRARRLSEHTPPPAALAASALAAGAAATAITVTPGVDWADPDLPDDAELAFVEVDGDLVEAVILGGAARSPGVRGRAVLLAGSGEVVGEVTASGTEARPPVDDIGDWLVRPSPALVRARAHHGLASEAGLRSVAMRRALLTARAAPAEQPWWRAERVVAVVAPRPRAVREVLRTIPDRAVEVVLHGVEEDPVRFLRAAGRPVTGPDEIRVHLVRRDDDAVAVITDSRAR